MTSSEITGTAQHAAWQARELPPVEEVRPGLWSIPVPIPHNPLRYVSVHAFALEGGGLGLVDCGWEHEAGWTALTDGLTGIGAGIADVRGVLITHLHFDHLGLAGRVREASGAWIAMHPADGDVVRQMSGRDGAAAVATQVGFLVGLGADRETAVSDVGDPARWESFHRMATPDRDLLDGDVADFPGWSLRAVHTPGHTAGHLCFDEERTGVFLSGDHVLPRISPNISTNPGGEADPLRDYLAALAAVGQRPEPAEVLPAHEWRFTGLTARTDALRAHHEGRLAELLTAVREHPGSTPWDLAGHLTWSRPWSSYERGMRVFAVTETDAHLRLLASRGAVVGTAGPVPRFTAA
ncbi:Glyoxylase, beta-lactamase superfamily II [Klenkia soli]|uniref:Glyoxylase, beta-lactamase superfamily II n=1 Tax=Klenkia soli TaxID=1052260 RepID=A0A1H0TWR7_9ACTN|nr:MBL fold metallo-hydrolase [Klenkia soli]SDP58517.1 Glyoxylase, beta-lactamase superfamily II [Klenkia soli]